MDGVLVIMNGKLKKWAPRRNLTEPARVRIPFIRLSVYISGATIYTLMLINQIDAKYVIYNQIFFNLSNCTNKFNIAKEIRL